MKTPLNRTKCASTAPTPNNSSTQTAQISLALLCIAKALEGGESDIASTHHVFNTLQREHPDVVETLCTPNFYFDRKGEVGEGQDPWYVSAIMFKEHDTERQPEDVL